MGKYNIEYCKENKVAILVENEEQIKELEKIAKPTQKENWKRYFCNDINWYIILCQNYSYNFSIQSSNWKLMKNYEKISFQTFIEDNMKTIPEKWYVRIEDGTSIYDYVKNKYGRIPSYIETRDSFYLLSESNLDCYSPNYVTKNIEYTKGYTEITFEQFKEKILNMNTEKKEIVAYELLKDLPCLKAGAKFTYNSEEETWNDVILGEECYSFTQEDIDKSKDFFKPVYEEEYKVGDYIYILNSNTFGCHLKQGSVEKIYDIPVGCSYVTTERLKRNGGDIEFKNFRKATKEEIQKSQQKVISVGGKFDVTLKNGKIYHKSDDITQFVELLIKGNTIVGTSSSYGKFSATISDIVFSKTGCQNVETKLSDWVEVYKQFQEFNK